LADFSIATTISISMNFDIDIDGIVQERVFTGGGQGLSAFEGRWIPAFAGMTKGGPG